MAKIIYDLIQRFEVENGVPRLVSTNIHVIEGGEDLMSLATTLLVQLGFHDKFEEKRTSQYTGYRLKNGGKESKRYQLVLAPRKEGLFISIPKKFFKRYLIALRIGTGQIEGGNEGIFRQLCSKFFWIRPKKNSIFRVIIDSYNKETIPEALEYIDIENPDSQNIDFRDIYQAEFQFDEIMENEDFNQLQQADQELLEALRRSQCCLEVYENQLFPYTLQVFINSSQVLKEFIGQFVKILMEQP